MLNHIWAFLIVVGILAGFGSAMKKASYGETIVTKVDGKDVEETVVYATLREKAGAIAKAGNTLTQEVFNRVSFRYGPGGKESSGAVGIAVNFIGLMALWLGIMRIAEASGLIQILARAISPIFRLIFPSIPRDHPASGAMLMNFAANMLGLDNAATPLGINAMKELQKLNGKKDTASNAMCMFLALNVSSQTLIPATVIAFRAERQSIDPTGFMAPMLIATACGTLTAFVLCKIMERISKDTPPSAEEIMTTTQVPEVA